MSLRVERDGGALVVTIDRPEAKNALSRELAIKLRDAAREASPDPTVRAIVLASSSKDVFVSGGDVKELGRAVHAGEGPEHVLDIGGDLDAFDACAVPIIAAVSGNAFGGGCELLLHCDLVVIERQAELAFLHARMGLTPAWGGLSRLVDRVGSLRATDLLLRARRISAEEAVSLGLANGVVETGGAVTRALEIASEIEKGAREAVAAMKRALFETRTARHAAAFEREREVFSSVWAKPAHRQSIEAFLSRAKTKD